MVEVSDYVSTAAFTSGIDTVTTIIYVVIILACIVVVSLFFYNLSQYKATIIIRDVVNNRQIISVDKARRIKDKKGNYWWKLLKSKDKISEPPSISVDTTSKGRKFVEFFRLPDGSFIPAACNVTQDKIKEKVVEGFEPLTTQERALLIHELAEAESYKKDSIHDLINKAMPYAAIVLILTVLLLFAGEFFGPMYEHQAAMEVRIQETWDKIGLVVERLDYALNEVNRTQVISDGGNVTAPY